MEGTDYLSTYSAHLLEASVDAHLGCSYLLITISTFVLSLCYEINDNSINIKTIDIATSLSKILTLFQAENLFDQK